MASVLFPRRNDRPWTQLEHVHRTGTADPGDTSLEGVDGGTPLSLLVNINKTPIRSLLYFVFK